MHKNCKKIGFRSYNNVEFHIDTDLYEKIMGLEENYQDRLLAKLDTFMNLIDIGRVTNNKYEQYTPIVSTSFYKFYTSAFKFKSKELKNARIYCQDIAKAKEQKRKIILCEILASKKQNELTYKEKSIINRIKETNYAYL